MEQESSLNYSLLPGIDVVVEELGDEVDVGQDHSPAAVSVEAKLIQCHALRRLLLAVLATLSVLVIVCTGGSASDTPLLILVLLKKLKIAIVFVACDLENAEMEMVRRAEKSSI